MSLDLGKHQHSPHLEPPLLGLHFHRHLEPILPHHSLNLFFLAFHEFYVFFNQEVVRLIRRNFFVS